MRTKHLYEDAIFMWAPYPEPCIIGCRLSPEDPRYPYKHAIDIKVGDRIVIGYPGDSWDAALIELRCAPGQDVSNDEFFNCVRKIESAEVLKITCNESHNDIVYSKPYGCVYIETDSHWQPSIKKLNLAERTYRLYGIKFPG